MSLGCVVLDLDDTVFLERDYVRSGFDAVDGWLVTTRRVCGFALAAWDLFESGVRGTTFDEALALCGVEPTPALIRELVSRYRSHVPAIGLLPDAEACIGILQASHRRLAVVSDGPLESQRAKAAAVGAGEWANPVVLTAELGPGLGKPHPGAFRMVEEATGYSGAECTYVADNPVKDFAGPRSLGWRTVRVRRKGALHEETPSGPDVDVEVPDLTRLVDALRAGTD